MSLGSEEKLLQNIINTCCSVRNDLCEMFCTRTPEQLSSKAVYDKIAANSLLLHTCKDYLKGDGATTGLYIIHFVSLHMTLCHIHLISAISLCETYMSATDKFRHNRDREGYKRALFTHQGKLHHADVHYHCACHNTSRAVGRPPAVFTSSFLNRCAIEVSRAYNIHSYVDAGVDGSTQGVEEPNISPLMNLIDRMIHSTGILYAPLVLPPDIVENTKLAADCRHCSRNAVIRGTMVISGPEPLCTCAVSIYNGTNVDGGKHASLVSARRTLFDTLQRSICMQAPLCDCTLHKEAFASMLTQLVHGLTGEDRPT